MNTSKSKVLVALLTAVMMLVMAVPMAANAAPTAGDTVERVPLAESELLGLRIEYRNYGYPDGMPNGWGNPPGAWAGQMNVTVTDDQGADPTRLGEVYTAFCLDFYTPISGGDVLQVDTALVNDPSLTADEALIVNYILAMYEPVDDLSGAAIQCAIWYFLTEEYGSFADMVSNLPPVGSRTLADVQYQFMTDPDPSDPVNDMYDAKINTVAYPGYDPDDLRLAAFDIIGEVEAAMPELRYPYSISITPDAITLDVGETAYFDVEVLDQYGDPIEGAMVCGAFYFEGGEPFEFSAATNETGIVLVWAIAGYETTFYLMACVRGGEAIWLFDPNEPMEIQSLAIPNCVCDEATATWEQECYYPDGHTPGFWKNNARKWLDYNSGESKKYVGYQVYFEDYEDYLDAITGKYGGDFSFLSFIGTTAQKLQKAYDILSYGGSDPMLKAQKHMLSALLTYEWYEADDPGYYGGGCVMLDDGCHMNIDDAIAEMLDAYASGDYEWAHEIAGALNEQGDS